MTTTIDNVEDKEFNWEGYEAPSEFVRPPEPGVYTFMRSDADTDLKSGEFTTKDGRTAEWFNFKAVIQGGDYDGRASYGGCNTLKSDFRNGTTAADFLVASKSPERPLKGKFGPAIEKTYGPFNAKTRWEWRCKTCEETFLLGGPKSAKKHKKYVGTVTVGKTTKNGGNVEVNHVQVCPGCKAEVGANLTMTDFVIKAPAGQGIARVQNIAASELPPAAG